MTDRALREGDEVRIAEWDRLRDHLETFCQGGEFAADEQRVTCEFPNAKLTVTRDGTVETGMPLHAFEREGVETLRFDHERGELTVVATADGDRLEYAFRRP